MNKRGNPDWGKPLLPIPALVTEFEMEVAAPQTQEPGLRCLCGTPALVRPQPEAPVCSPTVPMRVGDEGRNRLRAWGVILEKADAGAVADCSSWLQSTFTNFTTRTPTIYKEGPLPSFDVRRRLLLLLANLKRGAVSCHCKRSS